MSVVGWGDGGEDDGRRWVEEMKKCGGEIVDGRKNRERTHERNATAHSDSREEKEHEACEYMESKGLR